MYSSGVGAGAGGGGWGWGWGWGWGDRGNTLQLLVSILPFYSCESWSAHGHIGTSALQQ
jgi:hypothetical protein